jgi:flagellar hook-associated protein 3 FlgL
MSMRVTDTSASLRSLANLQSTGSRLADLQAQMSSGNQITKPSDNPSGTVRALELRGDLKRNTQYNAAATDAIGWLSAADAAYSQVVNLTQNARTLVVKGLNNGASTGTSAGALADQIDAIRTSLISIANTAYNGRPVFGGTTTGAIAYDPAGNYVGDNGTVSRTVGDQNTVQINQNGPSIFGPPGNDLFARLAAISTTLRTNPSALGPQLSALDTALSSISDAQAVEGATYQRVQIAQSTQQSTSTALQTQLSGIQDIDLADMAIKVSTANVTYQAALQTTASIRQMSLLNFLR